LEGVEVGGEDVAGGSGVAADAGIGDQNVEPGFAGGYVVGAGEDGGFGC
jgi:hypothetical protein